MFLYLSSSLSFHSVLPLQIDVRQSFVHMFSKIMNFVCFTLKLHDGNIGTEFTVSPLSNMDCKIVAHLYILFFLLFFFSLGLM